MCIKFKENIKGCLNCSKCIPSQVIQYVQCNSHQIPCEDCGEFLPNVHQPLLPKLGKSKVVCEDACVWCISVLCSTQFWDLFVYVGILAQDVSHLVLCILCFHCTLWVHFSTAVWHGTKGLGDETFAVLSSESHDGLIMLSLFSLLLQKYRMIKPNRYVCFSVYTLSKYRCEQTKECVIRFFYW